MFVYVRGGESKLLGSALIEQSAGAWCRTCWSYYWYASQTIADRSRGSGGLKKQLQLCWTVDKVIHF